MKTYFSKSEAVIDLHERGFTEDFQLLGNSLLWIQRKKKLRQKDFSIVEYHGFIDSFGKATIIFGVIANGLFVNGILINRYKIYMDKTPSIINSKLKNGFLSLLNKQGNYIDVQFNRM